MKNLRIFLIAVFCMAIFIISNSANAYYIQWNDNGNNSDFEGETTDNYKSAIAPRWNFVNGSAYNDSYNLGWNGTKWPVASYPRIAIVCNDGMARQGKCYAKFTSYPGDSAYASSNYDANDRAGMQNEFNNGTTAVDIMDNPDVYFGFSHRLPTTTVMQSNEWLMIGAFSVPGHNLQSIGGISLTVQFAPGQLDISYGTSPTAEKIETLINPYPKGVWHDYILRVKFSNTNTGAIQLWHRQEGTSTFAKIFDKANIRTNNVAVPSGSNTMLYWQQTLYRGPNVPVIQSSHFDNDHIATTYAEILSTFSGAVSPLPAHCYNSVQDGDEEGLNCGGRDCYPCAPPTETDDTPPNITITCPEDNKTYKSAVITVAGTASDNKGVSKVEVKAGLDGVYKTASGTDSWKISDVGIAGTGIKVYAKATDAKGNKTEKYITVSYDASAAEAAPACSAPEVPPPVPKCKTACFGDCRDIGQKDKGEGCSGNCLKRIGTACNDNNACTSGETCQEDKTCKGGIATICPADSACAGYSCDTSSGKCITNFKNGASCNSNNLCDLSGSGKCSDGICRGTPKSCADTNDCTFDSCDPATGGCSNVNACGGIVPCGRLIDNPETGEINETAPCNLCTLAYMLKKIINFATQIAFVLAILSLIIAGYVYATSAGDNQKIESAKNAAYYTVIGLLIIFLAWLAVAVILKASGYSGITAWNQVNCILK